MSPSIARKVIEFQKQLSGKKGRALDLNDREYQILSLLSRGNSYKMVAEEVNLSIDTIRSHVKKIYEKLHVHSVTEAIHKVFIDKSYLIASFIDPLFKLEWLESIDINQSKKDSLTSFTKHLIIAECQKMLATEKLNQSNGSSS